MFLTGLPRFDGVSYDPEKIVLFMPTWRQNIAGAVIEGTSDRVHVPRFRETAYARYFNSLINDERLVSAMRKYGYQGLFYLHPSFLKQVDDFDSNDVITVARTAADTNQLLSKCALLVTDFSSVQFDAAYRGIPVVYSQYDADEFNIVHTGDNSYFDWQDDAFGPICYDKEQTVDAIIRYLENDCGNIEPYRSRAGAFFEYRDGECSRRVFEKIFELEKIDHQ